MGITTLFDFTKIKIIDTQNGLKTTVAMFHWVNIDYDIFMKLELKHSSWMSLTVVLGEKKRNQLHIWVY